MLVEYMKMSTICIYYVGCMVSVFKDPFTGRDREGRVERNLDINTSEDALLQF